MSMTYCKAIFHGLTRAKGRNELRVCSSFLSFNLWRTSYFPAFLGVATKHLLRMEQQDYSKLYEDPGPSKTKVWIPDMVFDHWKVTRWLPLAGCFACAPCWSAYPRLRSQHGCGLDVRVFSMLMVVTGTWQTYLHDIGIDQDMISLQLLICCNLQDPVKVKVGLTLKCKTTYWWSILQEFLLHTFRIYLSKSVKVLVFSPLFWAVSLLSSLCWFKCNIFSILCRSLLPWPRSALISSSTKSWCSQGPILSSPRIIYVHIYTLSIHDIVCWWSF